MKGDWEKMADEWQEKSKRWVKMADRWKKLAENFKGGEYEKIHDSTRSTLFRRLLYQVLGTTQNCPFYFTIDFFCRVCYNYSRNKI